jgi:D-sedoheptulose 7-phosphate isomerase
MMQVLALDVDGVLTDGRVALTPNGEETKAIAFRDLDALTAARNAGLRIALITGEDGPLVDIIAKKTGAEHVLRGAKDKLLAIDTLARDMQVPRESICFVGDADRDAKAFSSVGLALAPADASTSARREAHHVLQSRGGSGAVAEAVEMLVRMTRASHAPTAQHQVFANIIGDSIAAHRAMLTESIGALAAISEVLIQCIAAGNKILFCGNGGSAADSQHVAAELVGRFYRERDPWPAIALTCDTSILTAVGNDWEFEQVFSRQVRALARPGDVVVGISTSGKSPNVVRALEAARAKGAITIGFTGAAGGPIADAADHSFKAPTTATPRVQELHILAWHSICEVVEASLAPDSRTA